MVNANYASLPPEVRGIIAGCCDGGVTKNSTRDEIREAGRTVASLARVDRAIRPKCLAILSVLQNLYQLATHRYMTYKYTAYPPIIVGGSILRLFDALMTGMTVVTMRHTFDKFTDEIHRDIRDMIINVPDIIFHCRARFSSLRRVTPLVVACVNPRIPLDIVDLLLEEGADVTPLIHYPDRIEPCVARLGEISPERLEDIRALFVKHGQA